MLKFLVSSKYPHLTTEDPNKYFSDYFNKSKTYFPDVLPNVPTFEK